MAHEAAALVMDETRAKLMDAAGYEFAEKGFDGATVRSICERAGTNLAAINYHFGDKERLYEAVLMLAHHSRPSLASRSEEPHPDPRLAFRQFVESFLEDAVWHQQTPWQQGVMFREIASPTKASDTMIREAFRPRFEELLAILHRLAPDLETRQWHAVGFSVIAQCLHYKMSRSISERIIGAAAFGQLDPDFLVDHITRFTLAALGQGDPLTRATPLTAEQHAITRPVGER